MTQELVEFRWLGVGGEGRYSLLPLLKTNLDTTKPFLTIELEVDETAVSHPC